MENEHGSSQASQPQFSMEEIQVLLGEKDLEKILLRRELKRVAGENQMLHQEIGRLQQELTRLSTKKS